MANSYTIEFTNQVDDLLKITITPSGTPEAEIKLTAAAGSIILSSNANDDDKTKTGILAKELQFGYLYTPDNGVGIETFMSDDIDEWKVSCYINAELCFQGFLAMESSQALFNRNEVVILKATDGLNSLKAHTPYSGESKNTVLFHLVQLLGKLDMPEVKLRTLCNVTQIEMNGRDINPAEDPLDKIWIDDKLFKDKTAYEALNIICNSFKCRFYQEGGFWWLENIGERMLNYGYSWSEYQITEVESEPYDYTMTGAAKNQNILLEIGKGKAIRLANADAIKYIQLPSKTAKLTFHYVVPEELFCNQNLNNLNIPIASTPSVKQWQVECWEHKIGPIGGGSPPPGMLEIVQLFDPATGDLKDQYMVIPNYDWTIGGWAGSPLFDIEKNDYLHLSLQRKETETTTEGYYDYPGYLVLFGEDGRNFFLQSNTGNWIETNSSLTSNNTPLEINYGTSAGADVQEQWHDFSVDSKAVPVSGRVRLFLTRGGGSGHAETHFKDIKIDIDSVEASRGVITGDFNQQDNNKNSVGKYENDVEISDLPGEKRYILGGLYRGPDIDPELRELYEKRWRYYSTFAPIGTRFTQVMSQAVHSHIRRSLIKIEGSFKGPYVVLPHDDIPGLGVRYWTGFLPRYKFTDFSTTKEFMLTGAWSCDLTTGIGRAVFVETKEGEETISDSDIYTFDYIKAK